MSFRTCAILAALMAWSAVFPVRGAEPLRVLILTGANNHDWQTTTPVLRRLFEEHPRFRVARVVDQPADCDASTFAACDAVVSNWSAFPEMTGRQWGQAAEAAFVEFIRRGGGFVVFHAASATSQDWPEFQQLVGLTWGLGTTAHARIAPFKVEIAEPGHPITAGLSDFWTVDELWHGMVSIGRSEYTVLARAFSGVPWGGSGRYEPVLLTTRLGEGRGVNLVLGHDADAMKNPGWRTLMLRGAEWAATGAVTIPPPEDWPGNAAAAVAAVSDLEAALAGTAAWRAGTPRQAPGVLENLVHHRMSLPGSAGEAARAELANRLAEMLSSNATADGKAFACRQLALIGTARQVPAIAALLGDPELAEAAKGALQGIGGPAAAGAMREALKSTSGLQRVGIIHALGSLADAESVPALAGLPQDADPAVATAAAEALGAIGTSEAAAALAAAVAGTSEPLKGVAAAGYLKCAEQIGAAGRIDEAVGMCMRMITPAEPSWLRAGAMRLLVGLQPAKGMPLLVFALGGDDPLMSAAAIRIVRDLPDRTDTAVLAAQLPRLAAPVRAMLAEALEERGAHEAVAGALRSPEAARDAEALLAVLVASPTPAGMRVASAWLGDPAIADRAAAAVVSIGEAIVESAHRMEVAEAMGDVIAACGVPEVLRRADRLRREAWRPLNLARLAEVSSPDDLATDGASGPEQAAVDGNPQTYWDETDHQPMYRFRLTFADPTDVSALRMQGHAFQMHSPKDYVVLCDGREVAAVRDAEYDPQTNQTATGWPACRCRELELAISGSYGPSPAIRELEVYHVPTPAAPRLRWRQTGDSLALLNHDRVVWQHNHGRALRRPCMHPVATLEGDELTALCPADHDWHFALWFSWMAISGVDYWATTPEAAGRTAIRQARVTPGEDFSARIELDLDYHPQGETPVMTEHRVVAVSPPGPDGSYRIEWTGQFTALGQDLELKGGSHGGGYAGMAFRASTDSRGWTVIDSQERRDRPEGGLGRTTHGQTARWMDFGLISGQRGQPAGLAMFDHPGNIRHPAPWFVLLNEKIPFGYFNPAPLFAEPLRLEAGKSLQLRYLILVHPGTAQPSDLEHQWKEWADRPQ